MPQSHRMAAAVKYSPATAAGSIITTTLVPPAAAGAVELEQQQQQQHNRVCYVPSVRGNSVLQYNDQKFTLNRQKGDTSYWECVKKRNRTLKCNARIVTIAGGIVKSVRGVHNHRLTTTPPMPPATFQQRSIAAEFVGGPTTTAVHTSDEDIIRGSSEYDIDDDADDQSKQHVPSSERMLDVLDFLM